MLGYADLRRAGRLRAAPTSMTREVADSCRSLGVTPVGRRARAQRARSPPTARLDRALSAAARAITISTSRMSCLHRADGGAAEALVLDVDRVTFAERSGDALEQNLARLLRSARKWQRDHGAQVTDAELDDFAALVRGRRPSRAQHLFIDFDRSIGHALHREFSGPRARVRAQPRAERAYR